jgi:hypothetical protein
MVFNVCVRECYSQGHGILNLFVKSFQPYFQQHFQELLVKSFPLYWSNSGAKVLGNDDVSLQIPDLMYSIFPSFQYFSKLCGCNFVFLAFYFFLNFSWYPGAHLELHFVR